MKFSPAISLFTFAQMFHRLLFLFFESNPNLPANKIHTKTSDAAAPQSRPRRFVLRLRRHVRLSLETLSHGVLRGSFVLKLHH